MANFIRLQLVPTLLIAAGILTAAGIVSVGCNGSNQPAPVPAKPPKEPVVKAEPKGDLVSQAREDLKAGRFDKAAELGYQALVESPDSIDASFLTAQVEAARGNYEASAELAGSVPVESRLGKSAIDLRAKVLLQAQKYEEAADVLVTGLKVAPDRLSWKHGAWQVLTRVGRREEASLQASSLTRMGQATESELMSLIGRGRSYPLELPDGADPLKYFSPGLGMARWYSTNEAYRDALKELTPQYESGFRNAAARALYGRLLAETQAFEELVRWHTQCDDETEQYGDYWAALGTYFFDQREFSASADALLKAVTIDPTDRVSTQRLAKVFGALKRPTDGEQFRSRGIEISSSESEVKAVSKQPSNARIRQQLTRRILNLGRPFEALHWKLISMPAGAVQQRSIVARQRKQLLQSKDALEMTSASALIGVDPSEFDMTGAMKKLFGDQKMVTQTTNVAVQPLAKPRLVNVASQVGIDFQWYQDTEINIASIPIHESVGGGIGVIDFDLDGWPDVYFMQGSGEPPTDKCTRSNQLVRNIGGRFVDVTNVAQATDFNYSSGIAAGDINQDGFADLFLGSLGHNRLLINNGDGTFTDATDQLGDIADKFSSSLAIADIDGDRLPDLFEAVYIEMKGGFDLPKKDERGRELQPSPLEHYAQSDRWFQSRGDGSFSAHEVGRDIAKPGTGLGVVVTDFNSSGKNAVFVGNDVRPNHYLTYNEGDKEGGKMTNASDAMGVANGYAGAANGCMGIASGDFNRDGKIDLHITNFSLESNNLYLQNKLGGFTDLAVRYNIDQPSWPYVGFGTKAFDVDRNGWLDLAVTNGHIFDMRDYGEQFLMPPQLLANRGAKFESVEVDDDSGYWSKTYLGRSMTLIDFDRNGAMDLLIGHLDQPTALLKNETKTQGDWIQFELVGTQSERDAIGAKVVLTVGGSTMTQWVIAGDGYFCSDEPVVDFGLGTQAKVDQVEIHWPSGKRQVFNNPDLRRRYLLVEGQARALPRVAIAHSLDSK